MPDKRHLDDVGHQNGNKRPRSNNASPAPPSMNLDIQAKIAEAKARAAQTAAKRKSQAAITSSASPAVQSPIELAKQRAAALAAKFTSSASASASPARETPRPSPAEIARERVEALHKRKAEQLASEPSQNLSRRDGESFDDYRARVKNGLSPSIHPSLNHDVQQQRPEPSRPSEKQRAPRRRDPSPKASRQASIPARPDRPNPYLANASSIDEEGARSRAPRPLAFNKPGKYIEEAAKQRRQAQLDEMRGMLHGKDAKTEQLGPETSFLVEMPPDVEWWDEDMIKGDDYENYDESKLNLDGEDSLISIYVLHPVQIQPPQDKNAPPVKPMYLTKKETAKVRRTRRKAELKEEQAKIRLGLVEPPPPKVKKSNLMRVLGDQAVLDPTAVEARVSQEIADRLAKHEQDNADRKLTKEQKAAKLVKKQEQDVSRGIHIQVYRINNLSYGKHRYQIDMNAKQHDLTGLCIVNPDMNLLIVEGGIRGLAMYRKLLQRRIKWEENVHRPRTKRDPEGEDVEEEEEDEAEQRHPFMSQFDENGDLKDLSENKCLLVWEGESKQRAIRQWRGIKPCDTEAEVRDLLSRFKMENMWNLAKAFDTSEVQTLWTFDPAKAKAAAQEEMLDAAVEDF